jgi:hypothetical protein
VVFVVVAVVAEVGYWIVDSNNKKREEEIRIKIYKINKKNVNIYY